MKLNIFDTEIAAKEYCDKCHEFLLVHCKQYSATKWATPIKSDKADLWCVKEPKEFRATNLYKVGTYWVKSQITKALKDVVITSTATELADEFKPVEEIPKGK